MDTLLLLLAGCFAAATASQVCKVEMGNLLTQFANPDKTYRMNLPCKYHAIRNQQCGIYTITLSPTNSITCQGKYIVENMWLGVKQTGTENTWLGRTGVVIASKFLDGIATEPFNTKSASPGMEFSSLFSTTIGDTYVEVMALNGDFRVRYGVYDTVDKHKKSGFEFECFRDGYALNPYPDQVCGNETERMIEARKKVLDVDTPKEAMLYDIFVNSDNIIAQPDGPCADAEDTLRNRCAGREKLALQYCNPIISSSPHVKCLETDRMVDVADIFWKCTEFVCRDFQGDRAMKMCEDIALAIDRCPEFPLLSAKVQETCDSQLTTAAEE